MFSTRKQYRCSDCGEPKETEEQLFSHIAVEHLLWLPYQCAFCLVSASGLVTRKASEHDLRTHVQWCHSAETQFTMMHTPDPEKFQSVTRKVEESMRAGSGLPEIKVEPQTETFESNAIGVIPELKQDSPKISFSKPFPKDTNFYYCLECQKPLKADVNRHLATVHVKEKVVCCDQCDYGTTWPVFPVSDHIKIVHEGVGQVLDRRASIEAKLQRLRDGIIDQVKQSAKACPKVVRVESAKSESAPSAPRKVAKKKAKRKTYFYFCVKCKVEIQGTNAYQHLCIHHLKKNRIYQCTSCKYGSWRRADVSNHISRCHNGKAQITRNSEEFRMELRQLKNSLLVPKRSSRKIAGTK